MDPRVYEESDKVTIKRDTRVCVETGEANLEKFVPQLLEKKAKIIFSDNEACLLHASRGLNLLPTVCRMPSVSIVTL